MTIAVELLPRPFPEHEKRGAFKRSVCVNGRNWGDADTGTSSTLESMRNQDDFSRSTFLMRSTERHSGGEVVCIREHVGTRKPRQRHLKRWKFEADADAGCYGGMTPGGPSKLVDRRPTVM